MLKYRVSSAPTLTPRFTFDESYREIKQFVKEYLRTQLKDNPTGATPWWAGMLYTGIVAQFLLAFRLAVKRNSLPLAVMAGLMLTGVWGVGHNQIHRGRGKQNRWRILRFALDLTGFSSQHQTITHALSHHQNANTNYDVEIYEFNESGLQWLTSDEKNSSALYRLVPASFAVLASQTAPFTMLQRFAGRAKDGDLLHTDIMFPLCMMAFAAKHNGLKRGLLLCWTMWSSFAAWFVTSSLSLHHGHDEATGQPVCYHEGEPEGFERDFARHQIRSTRDHSPGMNHYLALMLFAHLNCHTVHHLFPTIDRVYHEDILQHLLASNVGSFRDLYYAKPNNQPFIELYKGIFRHIRDRRFEFENAQS